MKTPAARPANATAPAFNAAGGARGSRFVQLITTTLLLVAGVFCATQAWLVWREDSGASEAVSVRDAQVRALSAKTAEIRQRVQAALADEAFLTALEQPDDETHSAALRALQRVLPDALSINLYKADISDVLAGDLGKFGYAKAAVLVHANQLNRMGPLQTVAGPDKQRRLALAAPVVRGDQVLAYAYVELPMDLLRNVFEQARLGGAARVEWRQGDGRGDLVLDSIGNTADSLLTAPDAGVAVADSQFRVGTSPVELFVLLRWSVPLLATLAVLCTLAGLFMWYVYQAGWTAVRERFAARPAPAQAPAPPAPLPTPVVARDKREPAEEVHEQRIAVDRSIFRAYDIRGVLGKTLTAGVAREIGKAIGSEARDRGLHEIAVARDGRLSGPELSGALIEGLRSTGCDVIDIGAAPTPVLYFATYHLNTGSGVMVTGSHNPPDYNGFKIVLGGETLAEEAIQNLYARISETRFQKGSGGLQTLNINNDYIDRITGDVQLERKLKVVVDCGNGIPGAIVPAVFEGIGCEVLPLFCEVDGHFPNHHPDPSDPHNLQDLILSVKQMGADLGLAFDGDGDRLGVVTANGEIIYPDRLLMLFAKDVLSRNPGASIIYDVKCTGKLQPLILQAGGSPIMWRTGHSLIKAKMRETEAELAGEMSGHFFFKERWYGFDDGIYAGARLLEILAGDLDGRAPQRVFDSLPKGVSTPELKITMVEGEHYRFIDRFRENAAFDGAKVTTIDGVRADWPDGWGLVRASNTTPVLVLRFDADNDTALLRIQDTFRRQLLALEPKLKLPF